MIEAIIMLLIWVCVIAGVIWLVLYVLNSVLGWTLPEQIVRIVWVIFALIVLLLILRLVLPHLGVSLP
jgi:formate hydrogenlyase subunit 4